MSYAYTSFIDCPDIQQRLNNQFTNGSPTMAPGHIGLIRTLNDPANTSGVLQRIVDPGNAALRQVELTYSPRIGESSITEGGRPTCTGGEVRGETSTTYTLELTDNISIKNSVPIDQLARRCQSNEEYVADLVAAQIRALVRKANKDAWTAFDTLAGNFVGGAASKNTPTKAGNVYLVDPAEIIGYEFDLAELRSFGAPLVVGGGLIDKWFRATNAACCASTNVLLEEYINQHDMVHIFDPTAETALGAGEYATLAPGAMQMLTWNQYVGMVNSSNDDSFKAGVIVDPVTGLTFDYLATRNCNVWTIETTLYRKFVAMPDDMFFANDVNAGVNGLLKFTATAS
jgi:hypothetical protein